MDIPTKKSTNNLRKKALQHIKRKTILNIGLATIFLLLFCTVSFVIYLNSTEATENSSAFMKKAYELNSRFFTKGDKVAAAVNQQPIFVTELDKRYTLIPPEYRPYITKDDLLKQMVDEKILLLEASKERIEVSDETVNQYILNLSIQAQTTMEQFEALLLQNGLTMDDAREFYKKSLILNELLQNKVFSEITISDNEVRAYYDENPELFTTPESLNVSHILICHNNSVRCTSELTEEEALDKAVSITKLKKDFAELALNYSDEPAAKVTMGNLGWVNSESQLDLTFLNATMNLKTGEVSKPVKTVFGYHIIKVWERRAAEKLGFETVKDQIYQGLFSERQTTELMDYVSALRNESEIIYFKLEQ
jgi:parvulin-like peptidyl-prolyl isomerase